MAVTKYLLPALAVISTVSGKFSPRSRPNHNMTQKPYNDFDFNFIHHSQLVIPNHQTDGWIVQ